MRQVIIGAILLAVLALGLGSTWAITWNDLLRGHEDIRLGYVSGVADVLMLQGTSCRPGGVTYGQMFQVVNMYMARNPQLQHLEGPFLVTAAFMDAWPCESPVKRK